MGKVAKSWTLLVLPLAGMGLVNVYAPAGMAVALFGAVVVTFSAYSLNVPATRAAGAISALAAASAVYLASGSWLLALAVLPALVLMMPSEAMLRHNRNALDFGPLVGVLASAVLIGLAYPMLESPWWIAGPGAVSLLQLMLGLSLLGSRKEYLAKMGNTKVKVGEPLPVDVALPARDGRPPFSLSDHRGKFVLLVFIRGDWCPVCHVMMRIVAKEAEALKAHGVHIAIISPTEGQMEDEAVRQLGLDPGMLWDDNSNLARSLDLLQKDQRDGKDVPMPVTILIDQDGKVRHLSKPDDVTAYTSENRVLSLLQAAPA
jgi:peroxiredoxin